MKQIVTVLALAVTALVGCSSTQILRRDAVAEWIPEVSAKIAGTSVRVVDRTGKEHEGTVVRLDEHQIQLSKRRRGTLVCIPIDSLVSITDGFSTGWITLGAVGGAIAGGVAGATIATKMHEETGLTPYWMMPDCVTTEGLYGGLIGAMVGGIVGGGTVAWLILTFDYVLTDSDTEP